MAKPLSAKTLMVRQGLQAVGYPLTDKSANDVANWIKQNHNSQTEWDLASKEFAQAVSQQKKKIRDEASTSNAQTSLNLGMPAAPFAAHTTVANQVAGTNAQAAERTALTPTDSVRLFVQMQQLVGGVGIATVREWLEIIEEQV